MGMINIQRNEQYINQLKCFLYQEYEITANSITPATRGYYGETWRVDTKERHYFLKLDYFDRHKEKYAKSLEVVQYLCDNGIDYIGKIIKTLQGKLYSYFNTAILGVFEWINGENIESDDTKIPEYQMLGRIYPLTKIGFDIPTMDFSNNRAENFYYKWELLKEAPPCKEKDAILDLFRRKSNVLEHRASRLSYFATLCGNDISDFFITHGDAGGNLIVNFEEYYIIDWDEVMYAPLERDTWVMCCHDWAIKAFADVLVKNGIYYTLRQERIAFYCYHMFFLYLGELLDDFMSLGKQEGIEELFTGWIEERIKYADMVLK